MVPQIAHYKAHSQKTDASNTSLHWGGARICAVEVGGQGYRWPLVHLPSLHSSQYGPSQPSAGAGPAHRLA